MFWIPRDLISENQNTKASIKVLKKTRQGGHCCNWVYKIQFVLLNLIIMIKVIWNMVDL